MVYCRARMSHMHDMILIFKSTQAYLNVIKWYVALIFLGPIVPTGLRIINCSLYCAAICRVKSLHRVKMLTMVGAVGPENYHPYRSTRRLRNSLLIIQYLVQEKSCLFSLMPTVWGISFKMIGRYFTVFHLGFDKLFIKDLGFDK